MRAGHAQSILAHDDDIVCEVLFLSGGTVVTAGGAGTVTLWDAHTGAQLHVLYNNIECDVLLSMLPGTSLWACIRANHEGKAACVELRNGRAESGQKPSTFVMQCSFRHAARSSLTVPPGSQSVSMVTNEIVAVAQESGDALLCHVDGARQQLPQRITANSIACTVDDTGTAVLNASLQRAVVASVHGSFAHSLSNPDSVCSSVHGVG